MRTARVPDGVRRIGLEKPRPFIAHQPANVLRARGIAAQQTVLTQMPYLAQTRHGRYRKRGNRVLRFQPRREPGQEIADCCVVGLHAGEQQLQSCFVALSHCGQRVERGEQLISLLFVHVEHQNRDLEVGCGFGPQMAVNEDQAAVCRFPRD
jgi:hypothetical protein